MLSNLEPLGEQAFGHDLPVASDRSGVVLRP